MKARLTMFMAAASLAVGAPCLADPVQWASHPDGQVHYYELIEHSGINWPNANTEAESRGWYLATVTTPGESDFVLAHVLSAAQPAYAQYWIGGYQDPEADEPAGGWHWVTGEEWSYTHWNRGEPNNEGGAFNEDRVTIYANMPPGSYQEDGYWNDAWWNEPGRAGYIVEIPEPATLALLALGGLALVRRRRKQNRQAPVENRPPGGVLRS